LIKLGINLLNTKVKLPRCLVVLLSVFGLSAIVSAADFFEDFQEPPSALDWTVHGDATLFQWNPAGHLDVTWDSTRTNSYFLHPLQSVLGKDDDFRMEFELTLEAIGYESNGQPLTPFEIALGFVNIADATHTSFFRGKGSGTVRNLVEFDYFPDTGYGDTLWPAFWSTNATLSYVDQDDYAITTLPLNQSLRVVMDYNPANVTLTTTITADGQPPRLIHSLTLSTSFSDFRVDAFGICCYQQLGTTSLHAQGRIDNIRLTFPRPVTDLVIGQTAGAWSASFVSRTNWTYQPEEAETLTNWRPTGQPVTGTGESIEFPVTASPTAAFTRVRATRE
jgi:hypothetical protein